MKRIDVPHEAIAGCTEGDRIELPDDTAHYVANVLRLTPDDRVELFDGSGRVVVAQITAVGDEVTVHIERADELERNESPLTTRLFQAIPKGKRWKWLLQKTTELGVDDVVPLHTRHGVVNIPDDRIPNRMERWDKIISSAARQSQRTKTPQVHRPHTVDEALELTDDATGLIAHTGEQSATTAEVLTRLGQATEAVDIWIGPEGGFTDEEVEAITDHGAQPISLGPRVLRTETAGIASIAIAQSVLGDM